MQKALEHQEHAQHAAEHGGKHAALIVAVLAALLAVTEQQAKHAEIKVEANAVLADDAWNQYQGKSTRQVMSTDLARMLGALDAPADPAMAERRRALAKSFDDDAARFQGDPKDGKNAIAERAKEFEETRDQALERSHSFDNAAAAFELGIVLATASAITSSRMLVRFSLIMGAIGFVLGVLGLVAPSLGAF
jgi:tetraacyldisaccharide-1-P 4'-kinase